MDAAGSAELGGLQFQVDSQVRQGLVSMTADYRLAELQLDGTDYGAQSIRINFDGLPEAVLSRLDQEIKAIDAEALAPEQTRAALAGVFLSNAGEVVMALAMVATSQHLQQPPPPASFDARK